MKIFLFYNLKIKDMCVISCLFVLANIYAIILVKPDSSKNIVRYQPIFETQTPRSLKLNDKDLYIFRDKEVEEKYLQRDPRSIILPFYGNVKRNADLNNDDIPSLVSGSTSLASRNNLTSLKESLTFLPQRLSTFIAKKNVLSEDQKLKLYQTKFCGKDKSSIQDVYPGNAKIEWYPWLGVLIYPAGSIYDIKLSTKVILVQEEIVLASAAEITKYPKDYFSHVAKVVLGSNTRDGHQIDILTYNFHPDFNGGEDPSLALIQLDILKRDRSMTPICPPPKQFIGMPKYYAMVTDDSHSNSRMMLYEMQYVGLTQCQDYYDNVTTANSDFWLTHEICAKSISGSECVWQSGVALVIKQEERWHLLGFGIAGPGCSAPSRYVDYMFYSGWVHKSVARIGRVSITRPDPNLIVVRRVPRHIQRYGKCMPEEMQMELYSDSTNISSVNPLKHHLKRSRISFNLTILADYDYTCIILRADYHPPKAIIEKPNITMKYYCTTPYPICYEAAISQIDFYIVIYFAHSIFFKMVAYGREMRVINAKSVQKYVNDRYTRPPIPAPFAK